MPPSPIFPASPRGSARSSRPDPSLANELRYLIRSTQPAIVFSSLAHLCVPMFSEECTVDVVEDDGATYRITYPRADPGHEQAQSPDLSGSRSTDRGYAVRTRFTSTGYSGVMTHLWRTRFPTPADASRALILVRHGVDTLREERRLGDDRNGDDAVVEVQAVAPVTGRRDPVPRTLDPAVAEMLEARARRLRQWARCETEHIARR
jgi:hypothetical protein